MHCNTVTAYLPALGLAALATTVCLSVWKADYASPTQA